MIYAIQIHETGGPEKLCYEEITLPRPDSGEVLIRHSAIGLNFIDVYFRTGLYNAPAGFTPGMEAAGIIEEIGEGVTDFKVGDRVTYATMPLGAYATARIMPAARLIKIPDNISDEIAAASMVKGMTAEYLLRRTYKVKAGDTILFHAAAGGVGLIACQWAAALGATVIGTVGSPEKAKLAQQYGCAHTILYHEEDITARVMEITKGQGVPVVYDSVGQATFEASLNCLRPRGLMVSFGNASGPVEPFAPSILAGKGSLYLTRPTMMDYTRTIEEYRTSAQDFFTVLQSGEVTPLISNRYPLKNAAQAHQDLEARKTMGSSIFLCD